MDGNNAGGDILIIDQVDLDLLEEQRLKLNEIIHRCDHEYLTPDQKAALVGVTNMLDEWSDERARKEEQHGTGTTDIG
jgi:hypothetical protein